MPRCDLASRPDARRTSVSPASWTEDELTFRDRIGRYGLRLSEVRTAAERRGLLDDLQHGSLTLTANAFGDAVVMRAVAGGVR